MQFIYFSYFGFVNKIKYYVCLTIPMYNITFNFFFAWQMRVYWNNGDLSTIRLISIELLRSFYLSTRVRGKFIVYTLRVQCYTYSQIYPVISLGIEMRIKLLWKEVYGVVYDEFEQRCASISHSTPE